MSILGSRAIAHHISSPKPADAASSFHSWQTPTQLRRRHRLVGTGVVGGSGAVVGVGGGEVVVLCSVLCSVLVVRATPLVAVLVAGVVVIGSLHPQNRPGDWQVGVVEVDVLGVEVDVEVVVKVGLEVDVAVFEVVVGAVVVAVVVSLQPNQPGVLHVLVEVVDVVVVVVVVVVADVVVVVVNVVVVVSSRQPHHPGVMHVSVRVRVMVEVEDLEVVVVSVPLLSYIFQLEQSRHSGVKLHSGTVSYFKMTSWITFRIL